MNSPLQVKHGLGLHNFHLHKTYKQEANNALISLYQKLLESLNLLSLCIGVKITSFVALLCFNSKLVSESKLTSFVALLRFKSKLVSFDSLNQDAYAGNALLATLLKPYSGLQLRMMVFRHGVLPMSK